MTTVINTRIGTSKGGLARLWLEGQKLLHAGVRVGAQYVMRADSAANRLELVPVGAGAGDEDQAKYIVSKRERNGLVLPLLEVRSDLFKQFFEGCEKVRVAIRGGRIIISALQIDIRIKERVQRLKQKLASKERLAVGSLFHGNGVLDKSLHRGLLAVGVAAFVQVGVEIEAQYIDSSLRNNAEIWSSDSIVINSDIRDLSFGATVPRLDLVCGGVPCTGASLSGRAKNKLEFAEDHSAAGTLFFDYLEFIKASNPAIALLENVGPYSATAGMSVIRSVLSSLGYDLHETMQAGPDFGAIENRKRLVLVAVTKGLGGLSFQFPNTHPSVNADRVAKLGDVLEDIPLDSPVWKTYDYLDAKEQRDIAAGKGFRRQLVTAESELVGTIGAGYAKGRSTECFLQHPVDPSLSRLLTPAEHAKVKGIPVSTVDGLSATMAHQALGQSVIFQVFEAVGAAIGSFIQGQEVPAAYYRAQQVVAAVPEVGQTLSPEETPLKSAYVAPVQAELLVA